MLSVIAGRDPDDPTSSRMPVPDYSAAIGHSIRGLRIGFDMTFSTEGTDAEHVRAMMDAAEVLKSLGAELIEVRLPDFFAGHLGLVRRLCRPECARARGHRP